MAVDSKIVKLEDNVLVNQSYRLKMERPLQFLSPKEILFIDEFLANMKEGGELCLVVHKGRLRFVTRTKDLEPLNHKQKECASE